MALILSISVSGTLYAQQDLLVSLSSSYKHALWSEKPIELCDVVVRNGLHPKGALFMPCDTEVSKVRFVEPGIMDMTIQIEPVKVGFTPAEEQRNIHTVYISARAKISKMEEQNKKFRKELEKELTRLFDEKAMFLPDAMYLLLSPEMEFTMYTLEAGVVTGTLEQLANH